MADYKSEVSILMNLKAISYTPWRNGKFLAWKKKPQEYTLHRRWTKSF